MKEECAGLLAKAERSIDAAIRLLEAEHLDFAASRGYFAVFYVAEALRKATSSSRPETSAIGSRTSLER